MSGTATTAPSGGVLRMSRRVMNLAHFLTQNARRHGDRAGLIWGERSWTWREIDGAVSALASALPEKVVAVDERLQELRDAIERFPRHAALKRIVRRRGVPMREDVRAPLRGLTPEERTELDAWLDDLS